MPSRRQTLSVLGTLTVAGLAGCSGTLDGGGPGENGDENSSDDDGESIADTDSGVSDGADEDETEDEDGNEGEGGGEDEGEGENEAATENEDEDATTADETFLTISSDEREIDAVSYEQVESASEPATVDDQHVVPVVLTDDGSDSFRDALEEAGAMESPSESEVTAYREGEAVHSRALSEEVIATAEATDFAGPFHVPLDSREQAEEIHEAIESDEV